MATAELAVAMPAIVLVLLVALSALSTAVDHIRCVDAARTAARVMARGDGADAASETARALAPAGSQVVLSSQSAVVRVTVTAPARWGLRWLGGVGAQPSAVAVAAREDSVTGAVP